MTPYLVPITPGTPQKFNISLSGNSYEILLKWNTSGAFWIMDISDSNGNPLLQCIPLITGADLLAQFHGELMAAGLDIPGEMIVQTTNNPDEVPDFNSLGANGNLYYVTNP